MSKAGKKVTAKFYIEKNITVTGGISKPVRRVTTFSDGYRFENMVLIDCNNQAIAYVSEDIKLRGKLISSEKYNPPEFENISDIPDTVAHNYICNGLKIKQ